MNATHLLKLAGITADTLIPFTVKARATIYLHLKDEPPPLWLLEALALWRSKNGPIAPEDFDRLFVKSLQDAWPKLPFDPNGAGKGRKPKNTNSFSANRGFADAASGNPPSRQEAASKREDERGLQASEGQGSRCEPQPEVRPSRDELSGVLPEGARSGGASESTARADRHQLCDSRDGQAGVSHDWSAFNLNTREGCVAAWKELSLKPSHANSRALHAAIMQNAAWAQGKTKGAITAQLIRWAGSGKIRDRAACDQTRAKRLAILSVFGPPYAASRQENIVSKGAYDDHSAGSAIRLLQAIYTREPLRASLLNEFRNHGIDEEIPSLKYCAEVLREHYGKLDAHLEAEKYFKQTLGCQYRYSGQVIMMDYTGAMIRKVAGEKWGQISEGNAGNRRGYAKFGFHMACDPNSGMAWIDHSLADTENYNWPSFLQWVLFKLGYAPEYLVVDKVSGIFAPLCDPLAWEIGAPPPVNPSVLLWLAAGVKPYIHTPERATGKAAVERTARLVKDEFNGLCAELALDKELAGHGRQKTRAFESMHDFLRVLGVLKSTLPSLVLRRAGDTRENLWNDAESRAERNARALNKEASTPAFWQSIVGRCRVGMLHGRRLKTTVSGTSIFADLNPDSDFEGDDLRCLIFPQGMRAADQSNKLRVVAIQQRAGLPAFHLLNATPSESNRFGFNKTLPFFGEGTAALPDNPFDKTRRTRNELKRMHEENVAALAGQALKEGTNNHRIFNA